MTPEQHERKKASMREWYARNREKQIARARAWEIANPERAAAKKAEWAAKNPERRKEQARKYAAKPEVRAKNAERPARKLWAKARNKREAETLSDGFVRRLLAQHTSMKGSEIPQSLVDAHRELMKLKRLINEQRT